MVQSAWCGRGPWTTWTMWTMWTEHRTQTTRGRVALSTKSTKSTKSTAIARSIGSAQCAVPATRVTAERRTQSTECGRGPWTTWTMWTMWTKPRTQTTRGRVALSTKSTKSTKSTAIARSIGSAQCAVPARQQIATPERSAGGRLERPKADSRPLAGGYPAEGWSFWGENYGCRITFSARHASISANAVSHSVSGMRWEITLPAGSSPLETSAMARFQLV